MKAILAVGLMLRASAAVGIPDVVTAGAYSISAHIPEGPWSVQVFENAQAVRYIYAGSDGIESFRITVYRVGIPYDKASLDASNLVKELVQRDGLNFQQLEFGRSIQLRFKPDRIECPAGTAYVYSSDSAAFVDGVAHYAAIGLLLPPDYRTRKVAFLVVGHQVGSRRPITPLQTEYLHLVLKGLKEGARKAPSPSRSSGTSAAEPPRAPAPSAQL